MDHHEPKRMINPGFGRRQALPHPKGRELDDASLEEISSLLGFEAKAPRRDLLIEYLHIIQDRFGYLAARHLAALASLMNLAMVEVYEVASFYAHFDIVLDGETPPPPLTVRVCDSLTCSLHGAKDLIQNLQNSAPEGVRIVHAPCIGRCAAAPAALVGRNALEKVTPENVLDAIAKRRIEPILQAYTDFESYRRCGGYQHLAQFREGKISFADILQKLEASGLRGLGGAGFPSATKWKFVKGQPGPRLMAVNGDEGEPGTFKDRHYLETEPHRFLEGTLIAAQAVEAERIYIYLRDEYPHLNEVLKREIQVLEAAGIVNEGYLELRRGAGAYICGEETAMLESIEGKRGYPRQKPPFPTQEGLFGRPTLIHNVETLFWIPIILDNPPDWLPSHGRNGRKGLRSFSVSGRVKIPGVKLAPAGITVRELIDEFCGGMADGHTFKGYLPGGASGGILPASMDNIPLDFGTLEPHGCFIGSAAVVVLSNKDDMREVVRNLMRFFEDESCGQCTPCRVGTEKAVTLLDQPVWDEPLLADLAKVMRDASICGLGQAATNPLVSVLKHFPEDVR